MNLGLFKHVLQKVDTFPLLPYSYSLTHRCLLSVLLNRSSPSSGSGRAILELVLTSPGQWIDCSLFFLVHLLHFSALLQNRNNHLLSILHQRNVFLEMSSELMCPCEKCRF